MRIYPCQRCHLMPPGPELRAFKAGTCRCRPDPVTRQRLQTEVDRRHRESVEAARVSDEARAKTRRAA